MEKSVNIYGAMYGKQAFLYSPDTVCQLKNVTHAKNENFSTIYSELADDPELSYETWRGVYYSTI